MRLLRRAALRQLGADRWQALFAILGIAAGVAVVVAVDLANASSREAMRIASEQIDGRATHAVFGPAERIDERLYPELRRAWRRGEGVLGQARELAPLVLGEGVLADATPVRVLGIDPVVDAALRNLADGIDGSGAGLLAADAAMLTAASARRLGLRVGDPFELETRAGTRTLALTGLLSAGEPSGVPDLVLMDIATAQEVLDRRGWLSRIDLVLAAPAAESPTARWLERVFPGLVVGEPRSEAYALAGGLRVESLRDRELGTRNLAESFRLNLAALGLLAMVVGLFLVHGAVAYAVYRRQQAFGGLRALGVLPGELFRLLQFEVLMLATAGVLLGLGLGRLLAVGVLALMNASLAELYDEVAAAALAPDPVPYAKGALVGLFGSLLVVLGTTRRIAGATPLMLLRGQAAGAATPRSRLLGLSVLVAAALLLLTLDSGYIGALLALGAVLLAWALLVPPLLRGGLRRLDRLALHAPIGWRMLLRESAQGLSRSGVASAALVVAVAAAVGMSVMVASFRVSVDDWLQERLGADLYFRLPAGADEAAAIRIETVLTSSGARWVRQWSWPDALGPVPVRVSAVAVGGGAALDDHLPMVRGRFEAEGVAISEPLALLQRLEPGDSLELPLLGDRRITGVFREYGGGRGRVMVAAQGLAGLPDGFAGWAVDTDDPAALTRALAPVLPPGAEILRQRALLALSLSIFDRTFRVTDLLQTIAGAVAALGLFGALSALALERRRQFGVLRTLGVARSAPAWIGLGEALVLGAGCGLLALPAGMLVAWVLVDVVNPRAFGWTMSLQWPVRELGLALLTAICAACAGALLPAWRLWRTPPREMLADARVR